MQELNTQTSFSMRIAKGQLSEKPHLTGQDCLQGAEIDELLANIAVGVPTVCEIFHRFGVPARLITGSVGSPTSPPPYHFARHRLLYSFSEAPPCA
jgi:hypothetical protein